MDSKVTLYEHDFKGKSKVFTKSCPDLTVDGFNNITSSVKCEKGVDFIPGKNYKGQIFVIKDGENYGYDKFKGYFNDKALSLRLLDENDFNGEPECTLYKHFNYTAPTLTFADDVKSLKCYNFDKMTSSVVVKSGVWVGFTQPNYDGYQSLFLKGSYNFSDAPNDKGGFKNDVLSSFSKIMLKPSAPGKMKLLKIDYDQAVARTSRTPTSVFRWMQVNSGSVVQTVPKQEEVAIKKEATYEFKWDRAAKVSATLTAKTQIPLVGKTGISMSADMSVSMGSTAGTNKSKAEEWVPEYPSKIKPYTRSTVTSTLTQGNISIPFTALLCDESNTERTIIEKGVFYGCQYFDFQTECKDTKIPTPKPK
ncbi:unnamed protein product [Mytilus coruscus]|uniref:Beta/gamma crystallin 'Greek key' domain-containing protein n=1 Tax=Mytilus coruscus TaxID=42192 RepID=A0A6J8DNP8_MYTCO|nr:unnamed protein product [Mytilus coruscus]